MSDDTRRTRTERVYRLLLRLFPRPFRERFGPDLLDAFRDGRRAAAARGPLSVALFWLRIVPDAVTSAAAERLARRRRHPRRSRARGVLMEGLVQDVGYAVRLMARRPALSLVVVVTLALGIGANAAIFSLVDTVLLQPVSYREPARLVSIREQELARGAHTIPVRPGNFFDWRARATAFEDVAWSRDTMYNVTGDGEPETLLGYRFSANMLDVLGVQPAVGRAFRPDEDRPGAPKVVVLAHDLWHRRYGGDPAVLGRAITLNGDPHTVIGVMPASFDHPQGVEVWTPIALDPALAASRERAVLRLVARLAPGATLETAQEELAGLYRDLAARYPDTNAGTTPLVRPLSDTGDATPMLAVLFGGVGFVLLIACANVASLLLADAASRRRELALRSALGASRSRVARQVLTESVVLALTGGAVGALLTWWARDALVALFPANIANLELPRVDEIAVGPRVFLFTWLVSVGTGLLFGWLPAWHAARASLHDALKDGDRGSGSRRTHAALIVGEVALSVVLLAGALLMVQSFVRLQRQHLGFEPERVLSARVILPEYRYADEARMASFAHELVDRLRQVPGVDSVGITNFLPLSGWWGSIGFRVDGAPEPARGAEPEADYRLASEDYFRSMGIRLVRGRTFTARDGETSPPVVIVNETLVRRFLPGQDPVGRRLLLDAEDGERPVPHEIVGVVADVRSFGLEEPGHAELFLPVAQAPSPALGIALRTTGDPTTLAAPLRQAVWSVDRDQPVTYLLPMSELAAESLAFRRTGMLLAGGFGLLALVLAAVGIYGVLSYSVGRRTREIGVRVALGATRREVAGLVVREGLLVTGIGVLVGLAAAAALTRFLASLLYGVRPGDPLTFAAASVVLVVVAVLAAWLPARRATAVDPLVALRAE